MTLCRNWSVCLPGNRGTWVRSGGPHAVNTLGRDGGALIRPPWSLLSAGIAALAIGFALGSQILDRSRVEGLNTGAVFQSGTEDRQSELARLTGDRALSAESLAIDSYVVSFDERFAALAGSPGSAPPPGASVSETRQPKSVVLLASLGSQILDRPRVSFDERFAALIGSLSRSPMAEAQKRQPPPDQGGHAVPRRAVSQPVPDPRPRPELRLASISSKQVLSPEAPEDPISPSDADAHTAIYDISAHKVYLPDGRRLEAHSGLGNRLDDPRYVSEKGRGATPPNVYDLSLREEMFHGVRALRLTPVDSSSMFGRVGLLAHSYMLGPNGQSNGCVSINDYPTFLNAYLSGDINRLVVVDHLDSITSPKTALGWIPERIRALFGRS
jgi:hypothetical protein